MVWPRRKETVQTTGMVFAFVLAMAIMLWMTDKSLEWVSTTSSWAGKEIMTKRWYVVHAYSGFEKVYSVR